MIHPSVSYQPVRRDLRRQVPDAPALTAGQRRNCIQLEKMVS